MARRRSALPGWLLVSALALSGCATRRPPPSGALSGPAPRTFVFVGTAAGQILSYELDPALGDLTLRGKQPLSSPPAALAAHHTGQVLVAVLGEPGAATLVSMAIDPSSGTLTPRGRASSRGLAPAFATLDGTGRYALVTHQQSGSVAVVAIKTDGTLDSGVDTFPAGPGALGLALHPSNQVAFVANRRAGTLSQFSFNSGTGMLTPRRDGSGGMPWDSEPGRVACHPRGRFTYVLNQGNDTISVHPFDDRMGTLSRMAFQVISTVPPGREAPGPVSTGRAGKGRGKARPKAARPGGHAGDLRVSLDGKRLYAINAGHDALLTYSIDETGGLTLLDHQPSGGSRPETLSLDPQGRYLFVANRGSGGVAIFRVAGEGVTGGRPALVGQSRQPAAPVALAISRPSPPERPVEKVPLPF